MNRILLALVLSGAFNCVTGYAAQAVVASTVVVSNCHYQQEAQQEFLQGCLPLPTGTSINQINSATCNSESNGQKYTEVWQLQGVSTCLPIKAEVTCISTIGSTASPNCTVTAN